MSTIWIILGGMFFFTTMAFIVGMLFLPELFGISKGVEPNDAKDNNENEK